LSNIGVNSVTRVTFQFFSISLCFVIYSWCVPLLYGFRFDSYIFNNCFASPSAHRTFTSWYYDKW